MKYHIEIGWNWTKIEIAGSTQMPTLIIAITHIEVSIYTNHRTIVVSEKEQNKKQSRADRISLLTNWYWQWERKKNGASSENYSSSKVVSLESDTFR